MCFINHITLYSSVNRYIFLSSLPIWIIVMVIILSFIPTCLAFSFSFYLNWCVFKMDTLKYNRKALYMVTTQTNSHFPNRRGVSAPIILVLTVTGPTSLPLCKPGTQEKKEVPPRSFPRSSSPTWQSRLPRCTTRVTLYSEHARTAPRAAPVPFFSTAAPPAATSWDRKLAEASSCGQCRAAGPHQPQRTWSLETLTRSDPQVAVSFFFF